MNLVNEWNVSFGNAENMKSNGKSKFQKKDFEINFHELRISKNLKIDICAKIYAQDFYW